MSSYKRTAHLLPAGIAGLCATLAITAAMVGTAAAAAAVDFGTQNLRGAQDFRASQSDAGLSALTAPAQDFGTHDYRGAKDLTAADSTAGTTMSNKPYQALLVFSAAVARVAPTEALQPGQTVASIASVGSIGDQVPWTPASVVSSAPQPGQTGW